MHEQDQQRYDQQMEEYEKKGYYTKQDGDRSDAVEEIGSKRKDPEKRKSRKSRGSKEESKSMSKSKSKPKSKSRSQARKSKQANEEDKETPEKVKQSKRKS